MRLNQFLDKLAMTPRWWFLVDQQYIRIRDPETGKLHCPITWLGKEAGILNSAYGVQMAHVVGMEMGLSEKTAEHVMDATDDPEAYPTLRRRVGRACGLTRKGKVCD